MLLKPVISEKSKALQSRAYTFLVGRSLTKHQIKKLVQETFGVGVRSVRTSTVRGGRLRAGKKRLMVTKSDLKKAIVTVGDKDKIDIFETEKKKGEKAKK